MIKTVDLSECPTCSQTITSSVTETEVIIPTETSSVDLTNPSSHPSESETSEDPRPKDFDSGDEENESVASDSETFVDIDVILEDNCNSEEVDKEENNKCHWEKYHKCLIELSNQSTYKGLSFMDDSEPYSRTIFDQSRSQQARNKRHKANNVFEDTKDKLEAFVEKLVVSLEENTYSEENKIVIEKVRTLTDFCTFQEKIKQNGPVFYAAVTFHDYIESVHSLPVATVLNIPDGELRFQYKTFCQCLGEVELKESTKNSSKSKVKDSKELIKHFLSTTNNLFENIELIMHITTCAAVKLSTESVVESNLSVFECHFHKGRPVKEITMK